MSKLLAEKLKGITNGLDCYTVALERVKLAATARAIRGHSELTIHWEVLDLELFSDISIAHRLMEDLKLEGFKYNEEMFTISFNIHNGTTIYWGGK